MVQTLNIKLEFRSQKAAWYLSIYGTFLETSILVLPLGIVFKMCNNCDNIYFKKYQYIYS